MTSIEQIFSKILPYIIGAIGGIVSLLASGFLKEYFDERTRIAKHKRNVTRQVLKICNEASTGNFRRSPRDIEHINSILTDLEGIDKKMEIIMNGFVNLWERIIEHSKKTGQEETGRKYYAEMLNDIEEKRKKLTFWANKIRVGK